MTHDTSSPDNTGKKQGNRFKTGQSGNPAGRPKGSRNKATLAAQELFDGEVEAISRKIIEKALEGDTSCLRLVIERILPVRKDTPISFQIPSIEKAEDIPTAMASILEEMGDGELTPKEAQAISTLLELQRRSFETASLERKIEVLSTLLNGRS